VQVFTKSAAFYDAIYSWKDYAVESARVRELLEEHSRRPIEYLLDIACGTGAHLAHLKEDYSVEGLDLDPQMLAIARERHPEITFHEADMASFALGKDFDALVCLFGSVGYVKTPKRLRQTMRTFARHLRSGGVAIVEPWLTPNTYKGHGVHSLFVNEPDLRIARMNVGQIEGRVSILDFHYLVGTPESVEYFTERHELGLFTHDQYMSALVKAGFEVTFDEKGLMGRGLYTAIKPADSTP
jgi:ubiquinone/menaquinone biosynthesis C-methylase UbiE